MKRILNNIIISIILILSIYLVILPLINKIYPYFMAKPDHETPTLLGYALYIVIYTIFSELIHRYIIHDKFKIQSEEYVNNIAQNVVTL